MAKTVLIIDDDPTTVHCLLKTFEGKGYDVLSAFDGLSGLEIARQNRPDIIILDIMMPELNGYSVCGFLRSDPILFEIPIIISTSYQAWNKDTFDENYEPNIFLTKPLDMKEVLEKVQALI